MHENDIAKIVFNCAINIHKELGPGLLESAYENCMVYELKRQGLFVEQQVLLPLVYNEIRLDSGYRIDILVENKVILEIKSVEGLTDLHKAQVLTYLKLSKCKLGLLMNFNVTYMGKGVQRYINGTL